MPEVLAVVEYKDVTPYLKARGLLKQYLKAKSILLSGDQARVYFKERQPQDSGVWSFRVNKQFRALGCFRKPGELAISEIYNYQ
jgi:hypothetical protein